MLIMCQLKEATIRDVMNDVNEPGTLYTSVSTVVRDLEKKGYVGHKAVGTTCLYHPILKKREYLKGNLAGIVSKYFDGSFSRMAAFFARENDHGLAELHELINDIESDLYESDQHE